jgi:hypothetical protein
MKATYNHAKKWNDTKALSNLEQEKSKDVHEVEIENHLKDMSIRFERSPNQAVIQAWSKDLAEMGYKHQLIAQVCKSIPYKMDKHPTLNEILALIKPYLAQDTFKLDDLTDLTIRCYDHLKGKFLTMFKQEQLDQMVLIYMKRIVPDCEHFNQKHKEMMVLNDWCRCYFGDGEKLLKQGLISNQKAQDKDLDYFVNPLKSYAKQHGL